MQRRELLAVEKRDDHLDHPPVDGDVFDHDVVLSVLLQYESVALYAADRRSDHLVPEYADFAAHLRAFLSEAQPHKYIARA